MQRLFEKKIIRLETIGNEKTIDGCWCKTNWKNIYY